MTQLKREDKVEVTNRSNSTVILKLPDQHFRAELNPKETRIFTYGNILDIAARPGGRNLIYNFLLIKNPVMLREGLNIKEEPEYWLTEEKIVTWMPSCPLNEFEDALNFAPEGVKSLIKKYAVSLPLNDVSKREAIKKYLNFDVTSAINNNLTLSENAEATDSTANQRRSSSVSFEVPGEVGPAEKAAETTSKYKRTATTTTI